MTDWPEVVFPPEAVLITCVHSILPERGSVFFIQNNTASVVLLGGNTFPAVFLVFPPAILFATPAIDTGSACKYTVILTFPDTWHWIALNNGLNDSSDLKSENSRARKRKTSQYNIGKHSQPCPNMAAPLHRETAHEKVVNICSSILPYRVSGGVSPNSLMRLYGRPGEQQFPAERPHGNMF